MARSSRRFGAKMPGVSTKMIWLSPSVTTPASFTQYLLAKASSINVSASTPWGGHGSTRNVTVRNSSLWADVAHPVLVGVGGNPNGHEKVERGRARGCGCCHRPAGAGCWRCAAGARRQFFSSRSSLCSRSSRRRPSRPSRSRSGSAPAQRRPSTVRRDWPTAGSRLTSSTQRSLRHAWSPQAKGQNTCRPIMT